MMWVSGGLDGWQRLSSLNHMAALLFPGWLDSFSPQPCTKQATSERETSPVSQWWLTVMYYWFFLVAAHGHISASYEALRINRTPHALCKHNSISALARFLLWKRTFFYARLLNIYFQEWPLHIYTVIHFHAWDFLVLLAFFLLSSAPWLYNKSWILNRKMVPILYNENYSLGVYGKKVF